MEKVESALQWGAAGALSCGGLLFGLAIGTGHDVRHLERLPVIKDLSDIRNLERNGGLQGKAIAAMGIVTSKDVLQDTLSKQPAVAALVKGVETHKTRVRHGWESGERPVKEIRRCVSLGLELKDKQTLNLKPSDPKDINPVLEHSVTISHPPQTNFIQSVLETSVGYIVTGSAEMEYILPPQTPLTAIGEISKDSGARGENYTLQSHDGSLVLSRQTLDQQIKHLERWTSGLKTAALFLGATGLIFTSIAFALKGYRYLKRRKKRRNEDAFLKRAQERRGEQGLGDIGSTEQHRQAWHCSVCWDENGDQTVFPACGHIAVCKNCAAHLSRCPVCRVSSEPRQIFYS